MAPLEIPGMYPLPRSTLRRFLFDGFEADARTGELRRSGERVPLQDVPFRFLVAVLERPGELVTREELRQRIWPSGVNLDFESALDTAARKVRQALGDTARPHLYLETLPGKGYRFTGKVAAEADPPETTLRQRLAVTPGIRIEARPKRRPRWLLPAALAAAACLLMLKTWEPARPGGRSPSLVVLPAKVLGSADSAFLGDGIPDTLSTYLAGVRGLETRMPPSGSQVAAVQGDLGRVAAAYQVEYLVIPTVLEEDGHLRLDLKLAEAGTRKVRWAGQFEGTRATYNGLLREAAQGLAGFLKPGWDATGGMGLAAFRSEVALALREGKYFQARYDATGEAANFDRALAAFRRAQALEPASAVLMAEIGGLFGTQFFDTRDPKAAAEAARWTDRALALDPRCGQAWGVRVWIETNRTKVDPEAALEAVFKAVRFAPEDARTYIQLGSVAPTASFQAACGRRAMALDPLNTLGYAWDAMCLGQLGREGEALGVLDRAIPLEARPGFCTWLRFWCLFRAGRTGEAKAAYTEASWAGASRLMKHLLEEDPAGGRDLARRMLGRWQRREAGSMDLANRTLFIAPLLLRLGLTEEAQGIFSRSAESGLAAGYDWLLAAPELGPLRGDPRFDRTLEVARTYARSFLAKAQAARAQGEFPAHLEPDLAALAELLGTAAEAPRPKTSGAKTAGRG